MQEQRQPTPWDYEPELWPSLQMVWDAFFALSSSRAVSMGGVGGIPFEAVDRWAGRYGVDDFEEFHALLSAMDGVYVAHVNAGGERGRQTAGDGSSDRH